MNGKERILAVLSGSKPDRVPWVPLIGRYYVKSLPQQGYAIEQFAPRSKATSPGLRYDLCLAEIEAIRLAGADILYRHVMAWNAHSERCTWSTQTDGSVTRNRWETPLGDLTETVEVSHGTEYISKYMISDEQDLRAYTYLMESMVVEPFYDYIKDYEDYIGGDGISTLTGPVTPIQELFQFRMGIQNTTYAMFDYEESLLKAIEAIQNLNRSIYRILCDSPSRVVITYEDTSTTVLSPDWYSRYEAPHLNEYADMLLAAGKIPIAHMCGKLSLLTPLLAEDRYMAIDSVCPPTTGDLEPADALVQTGKIIIGGLEPAALVRMSSDETYGYTMEKLRQVEAVGGFDRFMLCSGDSVAAGTPLENLRAVTRAVADFAI